MTKGKISGVESIQYINVIFFIILDMSTFPQWWGAKGTLQVVSGSTLDASLKTIPLLKRKVIVSILSTRIGHQRACCKVYMIKFLMLLSVYRCPLGTYVCVCHVTDRVVLIPAFLSPSIRFNLFWYFYCNCLLCAFLCFLIF